MKKFITATFIIFLSYQLQAQITITDNDMPATGTLYIRDNGGNLGVIDLTVTGANQTWDYTQLTVTTTDTITYQTVASTPLLYQFYFNNQILYPNWKSDLALPGPDLGSIPNLPITITDVINYFKVTPSAYYQTGFGATINLVPASQRYDPRDKILKLPNTYNLVDSNDFSWLFVIPSLATYGQFKTRTNETDGWGTLQLPNASYNTLRVKSTITGIDTFYVDQFGIGFAIPSTQYEYKWYANGEGEPVLTVNANDVAGNMTVTNASFKHTTPTGISQHAGPAEPYSARPNPFHDQLVMHYQAAESRKLTITLYDITGKKILEESRSIGTAQKGQLIFNLQAISNGFYTLQISDQLGTRSIKVAKF